MSLAYYNEHDPYAAHWLRNLIAAGQIAPGVVDERDIRDVRPEELIGFTQVHMFAGIGIWSHALRRAGWSDDRPIWTGSCPCQPFSAAGRAGGFTDERHLWPHWFWLVEQCRPAVVIGEQVASKDGLGWLDLVSTDMEGAGYAFGATDLCAAGIGVEWQESQSGEWLRRAIHDCVDPVVRSMLCDFADWAGAGNIDEGGNHIRQRLYFVGLADTQLPERRTGDFGRTVNDGQAVGRLESSDRLGERGDLERLADPMSAGRPERGTGAGSGQTAGLRAAGGISDTRCVRLGQSGKCGGSTGRDGFGQCDDVERMDDDDDDARSQGHAGDDCAAGREGSDGPVAAPGVPVGLADPRNRTGQRSEPRAIVGGLSTEARRDVPGQPTDAADGRRYAKDWLFCRDGKWRAARSGSFPLAHGATARVGRLRAYGNALDAETATRFCETVKEICDG